MKNLDINNGGFRQDNTEGYTQAQLDTLNKELDQRLEGHEPFTDEYDNICKAFADKVARR